MELTDNQQRLLDRIRAHLRELPKQRCRKQALNAEHAEAEMDGSWRRAAALGRPVCRGLVRPVDGRGV